MPLREMGSSDLTDLAVKYLPKTKVETVKIRNCGIYKTQLEDLLFNIDKKDYIQDAMKFLDSPKSSRESVSYSVNSEKLRGSTRLEVVNNCVRDPSAHGYDVNIYRFNISGKEEIQLTLKVLS
jgi:hypothetical protein